MFKLDTSKFKKLSHDKDVTYMVNPDGHMLVLDHSTLHPKIKEQLIALESDTPKKMADGGKVADKKSKDKDDEDSSRMEADRDEVYPPADPKQHFESAQAFADGGEAYPPCKNPNCKSYGHSHPNCRCYGGMAQGGKVPSSYCDLNQPHSGTCHLYADGGDVETTVPVPLPPGYDRSSSNGEDIGQAYDDLKANIVNTAAAFSAGAQGMPLEATPAMPPSVPEMPQEQAKLPETPKGPSIAPESPKSNPMQDYGDMVNQGYQSGQQAIQQQQAADMAQGHERAKALESNIDQQQKALQDFQMGAKHVQGELDAFKQDLNNSHIDPEKYWENHSKVSSAIGLILGGFNPAGRPNAPLEFLNSQIDRSIKAQMANMENKKTLLSALQNEYGNLHDASNMARLYYATDLVNKLDLAAANVTDPAAKARALQAKSALLNQYAPVLRQMEMIKGLQSGDQSPNAMNNKIQTLKLMGMGDMAKHYEERYVPGVGTAQIPLGDGQRDNLIKQSSLINATKELRDEIKNSGPFDKLSLDKRSAMAAKAAELQQMYRQGMGAATSEGEQKIIDNQIINSDPLQIIKRWNVDPKLKALQESMISRHNIYRKQYGLPQMEQEKESKIQPGVDYEKRIIGGKAYMVPKKGK